MVLLVLGCILFKFCRNYLYANFTIFNIIWDTLPNFLASVFGSFFVIKKLSQKKINHSEIIGSVAVGGYLVLEEFFPIFSNSKVFDINDIIFSWVGVLVGIVIYRKI